MRGKLGLAFQAIPIRLQLLSVRVLASTLGRVGAQPATCGAAHMSTLSVGSENFQLGSKVAAAGQYQLRIEADYVTCTQ